MLNTSSLEQKISAIELRSSAEREEVQNAALSKLVRDCVETVDFYKEFYAGIDISKINNLNDLVSLPIIRKESLIELQTNHPPFGGHLPGHLSQADYLFSSPGPIHEPGFINEDYWSASSAFRAAGFIPEDVVFNCFSYHLTPGAWILDSGARAVGCAVIPVGNAPKDLQLQALDHYQPTAYCGTPDYLKQLIDLVKSEGKKPLSIVKALVTGGALTPSLRAYFDENQVQTQQCYATAEIGVMAFESPAREGLLINEDVILEIVDPETGKPQPFGTVGEVVVTKLRDTYPLIRFGTGDLSCFMAGKSPCGRTAPRIEGWLGRADMTTKIKGMFVRPTQLNSLIQQLDMVKDLQLVVERDGEKDKATLICELADQQTGYNRQEIEEIIAQKFQDTCHLRVGVSLLSKGELKHDGKIIVDQR